MQGTLALLGGVMLFLGSTPTAHSFFFSKPTPASRMKERLDKHGISFHLNITYMKIVFTYYAGFVEKLVIPDGNCQMRSISDQVCYLNTLHFIFL